MMTYAAFACAGEQRWAWLGAVWGGAMAFRLLERKSLFVLARSEAPGCHVPLSGGQRSND